jgi:hypothetical protein
MILRRPVVWVGAAILVLSWVLAFPLRDVLENAVILPLAYALWVLGLFYKAMPQAIWWGLLVLVVIIMLFSSLAPGERFAPLQGLKRPAARGPVEDLALTIQKRSRGVYFKWLVANRLGKLAYNMLVQREGERSRSVFAPLLGSDWHPPDSLGAYLETGLHGSFSDYPQSPGSRFSGATPLDLEPEDALAFLESQMEARRDRHL